MKKNSIYIGIAVFVTLAVIGLTVLITYNYVNKNIKKTDREYVLKVSDQENYKLNIYKNKIKVTSTIQVICIKAPCDPRQNIYTLNFSEENINKVKNFIYELFEEKNNNVININFDDFNDNDLNILKAIMQNNESYLEKDDKKYTLIIDERDKYILNIFDDKIHVHSIVHLKCGMDCDPAEEEYVLNFSEENINKVKNFIFELYEEKDSNEININFDDFNDNDLNILKAIMQNNESYLAPTQKSIYFTLQSQRVNCLTSKLYVYNDNTYEFENTSGKFNYNVNAIIGNASKYEDDNKGPYVLTISDGTEIKLYSNNIELNEFISEINVPLDSCMRIN